MNSITLNANAKINLYLDITGRRADGYHLLKTVMQSVSLHDTVTVTEKSGGITLFCDNPSIPCNEKNIAHKAANAFFNAFGETHGVEISIQKRIPCEAGMGGGSADGAAVLYALNELYGKPFTTEQLCKIGVTVGADVPFCIVGGTKLCEGVGEIFTPLAALTDCTIVLVQPRFTCDTRAAYRAFDENPIASGGNFKTFRNALESGRLSEMSAAMYNVFEVLYNNPEIARTKRLFAENNALSSMMTGSGSVLFGIFTDEKDAQYCMEKLDYPFKVVVKPTNAAFEHR